jgi:spermidine/putrescine transport system ATP-binding protein
MSASMVGAGQKTDGSHRFEEGIATPMLQWLPQRDGADRSHSNAIEVNDVSKIYHSGARTVQALDNVSVSVKEKEFYTLLGPSGCGKTTLLRIIAGLDFPSEGKVSIRGEDMTNVPAYRRPVNMVFQSYALFPHLSVADNVAYGPRQKKARLPDNEIAMMVSQSLAMVRLEGYEARRCHELSGGQQQRVALARAIINRPAVLILDEPLAALDRKLRSEMQVELKELQRTVGITFLLVTHDQDEALSMSDRICVMDKGRVAQIGTPEEIYNKPNSRYVADFVGRTNFVRSVRSGKIISIRPESIEIEQRPFLLPPDIDVQIAGRVLHRIFLGEQIEYRVNCGEWGELTILVTNKQQAARQFFEVGADLVVGWRSGEAQELPEN